MSITLQRVVVNSEHPTKKKVHQTAQKPNTATVKETNFRFIGGALGSASFLTALPPSVPLAAGVHGEMTTWQFANPPKKLIIEPWFIFFSIEK
jgi:hypothetical protein